MQFCRGSALCTAETPPTGTLTVIPTDGKHRGIQLRAQTVDATIRQTPDGVLADTILWVRLSNPGKQAVVMPVALGGPQLGPRALPQILDVTLDDRPVDLERLEPFTARADGGPIIAYTLPITVPLKGSAALRVHYSQRLSEQGWAGQLHLSHHSDGALERHAGIAADDPQVQPAAPARPGGESGAARPPH